MELKIVETHSLYRKQKVWDQLCVRLKLWVQMFPSDKY